MNKIFLVASREFWQRLRTRGFILMTIGLPLILLAVVGGSWLLGDDGGTESAPDPFTAASGAELPLVGYVDRAGLIQHTPSELPTGKIIPFPDRAAAEQALMAGADAGGSGIEAFYVIPVDYRQTGAIERVSRELPAGPPSDDLFERLLLANLLPEATPSELDRLRYPFQSQQLPVVQISPDGSEGAGGSSITPFLVAMAIMLPLFTSGGYLLYSVTEEKSSRVMEILLASLQPRDLLAGKLLGLGALTLVQYLVWITLGGIGLLVTGRDLSTVTELLNLTGLEIFLVLLYGLGGYWLYAGLMAGIGALSPDLESSRTWTFVISLPMLIPIYLWTAITAAPQGTLAVTLSFIPFSSPLAMLMRLAATTVPAWQIGVSLALLIVTAAVIVWLMARLFRVQTLLSGESFSIGRFWQVVRRG